MAYILSIALSDSVAPASQHVYFIKAANRI